MTKGILLVAVSALTVAACAKKEEEAAAGAGSSASPASSGVAEPDVKMPAGFPKMTAVSYRGEYTGEMAGEQRTMTMEVAGWKRLRMEMPHFNAAKAGAGDRMVMVMDDARKRWVMFVEGEDAPKAAMVMPAQDSILSNIQLWGAEDGAPPKKVGSDTVAGLDCDVWESASESGLAGQQACITRDGIFLWSKQSGAEKPEMIATKIEKRSIDAGRFALPQGFEVIDMGPCMTMMKEMAAAAQVGKTPDMARMKTCQDLGEKASAIMGEQ